MISNPGSKFDFGTLIAYLIPGYILEFIAFCTVDSIYLLTLKKSLWPEINWSIAETALAFGALTILAYIFGLILDMFAHPLTQENELRMKNIAYEKAVNQFRGFIKNKAINNILIAAEKNTSDTEKRNLFIDSMFYRLATPEIWERQNWHWAFYEFSRQMCLLCIPTTTVAVFYVTVLVSFSYFSTFGMTSIILTTLGLTCLVMLVTWLGPQRLLRKARNADCVVYYRHRAWTIFAYLIETELLKKELSNNNNNDEDDDNPKVTVPINAAPILEKNRRRA